MKNRRLHISSQDKERLEELIVEARAFGAHDRGDLDELTIELDHAKVVDSRKMPSGVVTMNSQVVLHDVDTSEEKTYFLVFPQDANIGTGALSVLAPLGTAILGYAEGDLIEWPMPSGRKRRIRIEKVLYQPEAAGDFHR